MEPARGQRADVGGVVMHGGDMVAIVGGGASLWAQMRWQ
jgi:hypothetical protein